MMTISRPLSLTLLLLLTIITIHAQRLGRTPSPAQLKAVRQMLPRTAAPEWEAAPLPQAYAPRTDRYLATKKLVLL